MNKNILKQISLLSMFLGPAIGILTALPLIGGPAFLILMCLSSTLVIIFMTKLELLEIKSVQESAVLGAIIGFIAFIGFSIFYVPIILILGKFFEYSPNYGVTLALSNSGVAVIILFILFISVLCATLNAFSGFITYFGLEFYKTLNKNDEHFKMRNND